MAITLDGASKRIVLDSAGATAAEIWTAWVDWHPANTQWPLAFYLVGGIPLGGGLFIPPYFFLMNGWRVRPMEANHNLTITGNLFVDGGGVPVVSTLGVYQVNVNYTVPVMAQGIAVSGSTGPTTAEIAAAVWAHVTALKLTSDIQFLRDIEGGRWRIVSNQMVFYREDNVTEVARFLLLDANGDPTMTNPYERLRA